MCLCITLSCVLKAWKVQVGGFECKQQVWFPGMGSSTYGRKSSSPVFQLVARIPWRSSIARQTGEKKCFHMPYNLQTATIETPSTYFSPFPLGIQTQLFSEITSSRSLAMWLSRTRKLLLCVLRQSLELFFQGLSVFSLQAPLSTAPTLRGTQLDSGSNDPRRVLATCSHIIFIKPSTASHLLHRL